MLSALSLDKQASAGQTPGDRRGLAIPNGLEGVNLFKLLEILLSANELGQQQRRRVSCLLVFLSFRQVLTGGVAGALDLLIGNHLAMAGHIRKNHPFATATSL